MLARATARHLRALYVDGRPVVAEGRVCGIDLPRLEAELLAQVRRGAGEFNDWQRTLARMRASLTHFYASGLHCA